MKLRRFLLCALCGATVSAAMADVSEAGSAQLVTIATDHAEATVSLTGARVVSYKVDGEEVLWMPRTWRFDGKDWAHGGIPICWPWFGRAGHTQIHGFIWRHRFEVRRRIDGRERSELVLGISSAGGADGLLGHAFDLEFTLVLDTSLHLSLATTNKGNEPFALTVGFHPYLALADCRKAHVTGLEGLTAWDTRIKPRQTFTWEGTLELGKSYDHAFVDHKGDVHHELCEGTSGRRIVVEACGAKKTVVWNPGPEWPAPEQAKPGDLCAGDWLRFACVEPVVSGKEYEITLAPKSRHTLSMTLTAQGTRKMR